MKVNIVGGGTAGLIAALVLKKTFPLYDITLIESDSIGIIGVGEGSTEHWKQFIDYCDINVYSLVRETDGALKKGIKFENWNGDNNSYFHSLAEPFYSEYNNDFGQRNNFVKTLIANNIKTEDILLETNLTSYHAGIISVNQYHFNTVKLNAYLHTMCKNREITIVKETITDINIASNGDITSLTSESGLIYSADLFIDSTGFKRLLIGKLGAKWRSYKKYLPMNHALAFPTNDVSDLKPYTLSRALSSGWNWRISTRGRYGNGYVFCDDFIDSTKAHDEVQSVYAEEVNVAKDIKFEAGCVDKFWINNCVAIGLSASFVEPLEASSIGNSILQSIGLARLLPGWEVDRDKTSNHYNNTFTDSYDNIVDFVQLHYFTKRDDTQFWKALPSMMEPTDFIKEYLPLFKKTLPIQSYFGDGGYRMFNAPNWAQVMVGLGMVDKDYITSGLYKTSGEGMATDQLKSYETYVKNQQNSILIDHSSLLHINQIVLKIDRP
jgi:tryptophan halogenase